MEQCAGADCILLANQFNAAFADNLFEILDGLEIGVDQRLIHELPEVFGGLQLWAVRRLEHEPDAAGHNQIFRSVPSSAIELQHDALAFARARRFGKVQKNGLEHLL